MDAPPPPQPTQPTQPRPPQPPAGRRPVVATDMDRTFTTPDLRLSPGAMERARLLRQRGVRVVLVTGRPERELPLHALRPCFDAMVLEGGAVWGRPGRWDVAPTGPAFWRLAEAIAAAGTDVRAAAASLSVAATPAAEAMLAAQGDAVAWHRNADRIDVTPAGIDKGSGLREALRLLELDAPWVLAVGDSPNDLPLFAAADASVAVANAVPELRSRADAVAPEPADRGFVWATGAMGPL